MANGIGTDPFLLEAKNQLVQNLIVFSGLIFSLRLADGRAVAWAVAGYFIVSAVTIGTRAANFQLAQGGNLPRSPWIEAQMDRGRLIPPLVAFGLLLLITVPISRSFFFLCLGLVVLGMAHDLLFRHVPILDVLTIAVEFIAKAATGAAILGVATSSWLVICTFVTALLLAIGQRRNEFQRLEESSRRPVLDEYTPQLLDQMVSVAASATLMAYSLYTISDRTVQHLGTDKLVYSIPFVLYGVLRYLYLVYTKDLSGGIEKTLVRDVPLLVNIAAWLAFVVVILY